MFTNRSRIIVILIFLLVFGFAVYMEVYPIAGIALIFIGMLVVGYYREGPIILASKQYHEKNYEKAEALLRQIKKPDWLSKKRRGFYEFMMGGIALQRKDFDIAEHHFELAAQFPLRSVNDHAAALVHVANISIRNNRLDKAVAYLNLAHKHDDKISAKMKSVIATLEKEIKNHRI
jgi:tetratricopeptide (TPR) repeat protein